jgi:hypothetical protein
VATEERPRGNRLVCSVEAVLRHNASLQMVEGGAAADMRGSAAACMGSGGVAWEPVGPHHRRPSAKRAPGSRRLVSRNQARTYLNRCSRLEHRGTW